MTSSALYVVRSATACRRWLLRLAGAGAAVALIGGVGIGLVGAQDRPDQALALNSEIESAMSYALEADPVLSPRIKPLSE